MSREIKFRAWDKPDEMSFPDGCMSYFDVKNFISGDYDFLMQYTGLKDKNGTEIYEGDIVRRYGFNEIFIVMNGAYKLEEYTKHDNQQWHFGYYLKGYQGVCKSIEDINWLIGDDYNFYRKDLLEIIGNIHENPELVK